MSAYINSYEVACDAGDTAGLMDAIYNKNSAISIDTSYLEGEAVGLGIMPKYDDFYETMGDVVQKILDKSNLNNFHNTLLILGSSVGGMQESEKIFFRDKNYKNLDPKRHSIHVLSDYLTDRFDFYDTRSISTACTSSANALLLAKRLIDVDAYENILVVGADALCYTTVHGFHYLSVLSNEKCRPFDKERSGMNVSEAVAGLLIQNIKTTDSIELKGVGASSDAYHMTNPDPEAKGAISCMSAAIKDAGLTPNDIDYINAHGTATVANDNVEAFAIESLFDKTYVSSTKAITGHTLGAAGAIEAVVSCEVLKRSLI
ncbi:MAG: beta-ketoacyl synthase N-terminal-like domain-containing protein, partial [Thiovulaceae bacterium]|nr:beta-ketoacyl synthase N-terminal-like domain-containing protein [Sulfurimonadaceae bacterium]